MTPLQIGIGGLALVFAVLALAQRLGSFENKQLAKLLAGLAACLFVAWCFLLFPVWVGWAASAIVWSGGLWLVCAWVTRSSLLDGRAVAATAQSRPQPEVATVEVAVTFDPSATYKLKVTPLFRNITGDCIDVRLLSWTPATIRVKSPFVRGTLQTKRPSGRWEPEKAAEEVHVRDGDLFHLWIAPDDQHSQSEVERARDERRLGSVVLLVNGQTLAIAL